MLTVTNSLPLLKPSIVIHLHETLFIEATTTVKVVRNPNKPTSLTESKK